jgi:LysM repeat protein
MVLQIPHCGAGTCTGTTTGGERTHVVQQGENLFRIALQYNMSWEELAEYNGITNPDSIYPGQVLRIPPSS